MTARPRGQSPSRRRLIVRSLLGAAVVLAAVVAVGWGARRGHDHGSIDVAPVLLGLGAAAAWTLWVWRRVIAARVWPQRLIVLYDGGCGLCRRGLAIGRAVDTLDRVAWIDLHDAAARREAGVGWLPEHELLLDMHAVLGSRVWRGYDAYRVIARRVPAAWPILPLLYLPPVAWAGRRLYRRLADTRRCALPERTSR
jgi:predicted DCC family thiol-disulfide oxidoreductase YuxK